MKDEKKTRRKGEAETRGRGRHTRRSGKTAGEKNLLSLNIPASLHLRVSVSSFHPSSFVLHPLKVLVDKAADGAPHYSAASTN